MTNNGGKPSFPKTKDIQMHEVEDAMHSLWVSFNVYLGLECDENPAPKVGFRFEKNEEIRDRYFGLAIRMRNKYASLVTRFKLGSELLAQMTKELSVAHKGACWRDGEHEK